MHLFKNKSVLLTAEGRASSGDDALKVLSAIIKGPWHQQTQGNSYLLSIQINKCCKYNCVFHYSHLITPFSPELIIRNCVHLYRSGLWRWEEIIFSLWLVPLKVAGKIFKIRSQSGSQSVPLLSLFDLNSQHGGGEGENDSRAITVAPCHCAKELDTRSG